MGGKRRREQRLGAGGEQDEAGKKAVGKGEGAGRPLPVTSVAGAGDGPVATVNPGGGKGGLAAPQGPRPDRPLEAQGPEPGALRDGDGGDAPRLGPGRVREWPPRRAAARPAGSGQARPGHGGHPAGSGRPRCRCRSRLRCRSGRSGGGESAGRPLPPGHAHPDRPGAPWRQTLPRRSSL